MQDKDEDWGGEDSDDDIDDDDLNISDEDDSFGKKIRAKQRGKGANNLKSTREFKSAAPATRRRRVRTSFEDEEEESSAEDSENDSNEDFKNMRRRDAPVRRKNGNQFVSDRNNELRTSGRSVRKVSYVESDESEDLDEGKKKKNQKVCSFILLLLLIILSISLKNFIVLHNLWILLIFFFLSLSLFEFNY